MASNSSSVPLMPGALVTYFLDSGLTQSRHFSLLPRLTLLIHCPQCSETF